MAAKQELFESVRAVVSGRLRDDSQVRELAMRVAEESTALRRRVERAVEYARKGLRLEACAEAEAEPNVSEMAAAFETDEMRQWRSLCAKNRLPVPEQVSPESINEIEEAIAFTAPLRSRLALMRRLVLSDAPAWHRLETLRELVSRDPDNPAWQEDRAALEPVAADELGDQFEEDLRKGRLEDAEQCVQRLEDGQWHWSGAAKVAAGLRRRLDAALVERSVEEAVQCLQRLEAERAAENELGARTELDGLRALEHRLAAHGGEMPAELAERVEAVSLWLSDRASDASARRENRERVADLDRLANDEAATLEQLRGALRAAEQTVEGVPDDVRAVVERRVDAMERSRRVRRVALLAAIVAVVAAGAVVAAMAVSANLRSQEVESLAALVRSNVEAGRLQEADRLLAEADLRPEIAADERLASERARLADVRAKIAEKAQRFSSLLAEAGDPESPAARPDRVEEAKQFVATEAEQASVADWIRRHGRAVEARRAERVRAGLEQVRAIREQVAAAEPSADPSWDGRLSQWESALADVQRANADLPEVVDGVGNARTLVASQRQKVQAARVEQERSGKLATLGAAAASPASLVAVIEAYAAAHPGTPEARELERAKAGRAAWEALVAWGSIKPAPVAALAGRPQGERDATAAALKSYLDAHPQTPFRAECTAAQALLLPAPQWRTWLDEKLASLEPLGYWMIELKDGTRRYCRKNPKLDPWQQRPGTATKSVMVLQGKSGKESFEEFQQSLVKFEGESPQMTLAKQLREALADDERSVNDLDAAFDVLAAIRAADGLDGALAASLSRGLVESLLPQAPAPLRAQLEAAAKRLAREKPDDIDWINPRDTEARERSKAALAAMREVVQPDRWQRAYESALASACAPFARRWVPAGALAKPGGEPRFLPVADGAPRAGAELVAVEPGVGDAPARIVPVGTVRAGGADFLPSAGSFPAGTMLFVVRGGAP
jgi:hypothetical protein